MKHHSQWFDEVIETCIPADMRERFLAELAESDLANAPKYLRRANNLDQRDRAIRELASRFYDYLPSDHARADAIETGLKRRAQSKTNPQPAEGSREAALDTVLLYLGGRFLKARQIRSVLAGHR